MNNSNATIRLDAATLTRRIKDVLYYADGAMPTIDKLGAEINLLEVECAGLFGYRASEMFCISKNDSHCFNETAEMKQIVKMCNQSVDGQIEIDQRMFERIENFNNELFDNHIRSLEVRRDNVQWRINAKKLVRAQTEDIEAMTAAEHEEEPGIKYVPSDDSNSGRALVLSVTALAAIVIGALLLA